MSMLCVLTLAVAMQGGEAFVASSERFGYSGTVSVYNTEADAKAGKNARYAGITWPQRLGSIYMVKNRPEFWEQEYNAFLTNWYDSPLRNGAGNPHNTNLGFVQMYDANATNWQNQKANWSKDLKTFTAYASGRNATYPSSTNPGQFARCWNAGAPAGSGESTKGTFISYEYSITAKFTSPATKGSDGFYTSTGNATQYSGFFRAIFRNESASSPASNGYYVVNLTLNSSGGAQYPEPDTFGSNVVSK